MVNVPFFLFLFTFINFLLSRESDNICNIFFMSIQFYRHLLHTMYRVLQQDLIIPFLNTITCLFYFTFKYIIHIYWLQPYHLFEYNPSGYWHFRTYSKVTARPLILLQSVRFISISRFPSLHPSLSLSRSLSISLSLYEIHIKGLSETTYSSTICLVFGFFGLGLFLIKG